MSISKKTWVSEAPKKVFLWLTLLCTLLLTGLNLPHSAVVSVAQQTLNDKDFLLSGSQAEISPTIQDGVLDLGYKEESEEEESKEEEENEQKREQEKKPDTSLLLPASSAKLFSLLFFVCTQQAATADTTAVCTTQAIPKYILYQQFKYHLG